MKYFGFVFGCSILAGCLLFVACSSDNTASAPNPRTIRVNIKNLDEINAVHIYIGEEEPSDENLVLLKETIIAMVFAPRIGHTVTVYVAQNKVDSLPFYSVSIRVIPTSWDSREAELHWTGNEIIPVGW